MKTKFINFLKTLLFYLIILIIIEGIIVVAAELVHVITPDMHFKDFFLDTRLQSFVILFWLFLLILLQTDKQ